MTMAYAIVRILKIKFQQNDKLNVIFCLFILCSGVCVCVSYQIKIGVPLMLMCLSNLGRVLAEFVQQTYARLCIRQSQHQRCATDDEDEPVQNERQQYQSMDDKNEVKME